MLHAGIGSGVHGSIKSSDLAGMSAAGAAPMAATPQAPQGGYIDIPVSNVRGVIAKRLLESKQQIPHYYVTAECQVDKVRNTRSIKSTLAIEMIFVNIPTAYEIAC